MVDWQNRAGGPNRALGLFAVNAGLYRGALVSKPPSTGVILPFRFWGTVAPVRAHLEAVLWRYGERIPPFSCW
jgi:hypothetical protein